MIRNIQMLRAVAAVMVFFFHADAHYKAMGGVFSPFSRLAGIGYSGVDIFFVISGFVVAHTTRNSTRTLSNAGSFARRRLLRIYLGYWPFFGLALVLTYIYSPAALRELDLLGSFFLVTIEARRMLVFVTWSLTFELLCYAIVSVALLMPVRLARLSAYVLGVGVSSVLILTFGTPHSVPLMFVSFLLEFLAGVMLYTQRRRLKSRWWIGPLALAVLVTFALGSHLNATNDSVRIFTFGVGAVAAVMLSLVLEQTGTYIAGKIWVALGNASYTIYLIHPSLLTVFYYWGVRDFLAGQPVFFREAGFFFYLGLGIWISHILYVRMERPLYRWASVSAGPSASGLRP
jgi:peptidoglycan/LPS O-acetylase OafA/YrhL